MHRLWVRQTRPTTLENLKMKTMVFSFDDKNLGNFLLLAKIFEKPLEVHICVQMEAIQKKFPRSKGAYQKLVTSVTKS